jgi:hypothetical protein
MENAEQCSKALEISNFHAFLSAPAEIGSSAVLAAKRRAKPLVGDQSWGRNGVESAQWSVVHFGCVLSSNPQISPCFRRVMKRRKPHEARNREEGGGWMR